MREHGDMWLKVKIIRKMQGRIYQDGYIIAL